MKNNRYIKIISSGVFLCVLIYMIFLAQSLLSDKYSIKKHHSFFDKTQQFDVLFFGPSITYTNVFPMELWNEYHITSYTFGNSSHSIGTSYEHYKLSKAYHKPKLVVIDTLQLSDDSKHVQPLEFTHHSFDAFPLSIHKIKAVTNLYKDNRSRLELLFPLSIYHYRWPDLTKEDFQVAYECEYGAQSRISVAEPIENEPHTDQKMEQRTQGIESLEEFIQDCQAEGIEVLLVYYPFPLQQKWETEANTVYDIAEKYKVNYLNFQRIEGIIDFKTDLADPTIHLNPSGARKVTSKLGDYILKNYDLGQTADTARWNKAYKNYEKFKIDNLKNQNSLNIYLMLLNDRNLECKIWVKDNAFFEENPRINEFIKNVSNKQIYFDNKQQSNVIKIKAYMNGEIIDESVFEITQPKDGYKTTISDLFD